MKTATSRGSKGPRRDLSKERFWRKTLKEHAAGGQDVRRFCRERGLAEPSFYAWRRAIAERDHGPAAPAAKRPRFVELRPRHPAPAEDATPLEIVAGRHRLLVRPGCARGLLRDVLALLGGVTCCACPP